MNNNPYEFEKELTVVGIHTKNECNYFLFGRERVWYYLKKFFNYTYNDYENNVKKHIQTTLYVKEILATYHTGNTCFGSSQFKIKFSGFDNEETIPQQVYIDLTHILMFK